MLARLYSRGDDDLQGVCTVGCRLRVAEACISQLDGDITVGRGTLTRDGDLLAGLDACGRCGAGEIDDDRVVCAERPGVDLDQAIIGGAVEDEEQVVDTRGARDVGGDVGPLADRRVDIDRRDDRAGLRVEAHVDRGALDQCLDSGGDAGCAVAEVNLGDAGEVAVIDLGQHRVSVVVVLGELGRRRVDGLGAHSELPRQGLGLEGAERIEVLDLLHACGRALDLLESSVLVELQVVDVDAAVVHDLAVVERSSPCQAGDLRVIGEVAASLVGEHVRVVVAARSLEPLAVRREGGACELLAGEIHRIVADHVGDLSGARVGLALDLERVVLAVADREVGRVRVVVLAVTLEHRGRLEHSWPVDDRDACAARVGELGVVGLVELDDAGRLRVVGILRKGPVATEVQVGLAVVVDEDLRVEQPHAGGELDGIVLADQHLAVGILPGSKRRATDDDAGAGAAVAEVQVDLFHAVAVKIGGDSCRRPGVACPLGHAVLPCDGDLTVVDPVDHVVGGDDIEMVDPFVPTIREREAVGSLLRRAVLLVVAGRVNVEAAVVDQVVRISSELVPHEGVVIADGLGLDRLDGGLVTRGRGNGRVLGLDQRDVVDLEVDEVRLRGAGLPVGLEECVLPVPDIAYGGVLHVGHELPVEADPLVASRRLSDRVEADPVGEVGVAEREGEALGVSAAGVAKVRLEAIGGSGFQLARDVGRRAGVCEGATAQEERMAVVFEGLQRQFAVATVHDIPAVEVAVLEPAFRQQTRWGVETHDADVIDLEGHGGGPGSLELEVLELDVGHLWRVVL